MEAKKLALRTPEQVGMFLYRRLEGWRLVKGYSVRDLADKLQISHSTYYKMSLGVCKRVTLQFVLDIAHLLGVRLDELFDPSTLQEEATTASRQQLYAQAAMQLNNALRIVSILAQSDPSSK